MALAGEVRGNATVRQVAGGDDVWQRVHCQPADAPALGQVHLEEGAMSPSQPAERMQRLHHACALRPPGSDAARQRHHRHCTRTQRLQPLAAVLRQRLQACACVEHMTVFDIADVAVGRQAILRQAQPARAHVGTDLLVLHRIETMFGQHGCERPLVLLVV